MEQNENTLSVLKIAPGQQPQQVEIDNDLKALQQAGVKTTGAVAPGRAMALNMPAWGSVSCPDLCRHLSLQ